MGWILVAVVIYWITDATVRIVVATASEPKRLIARLDVDTTKDWDAEEQRFPGTFARKFPNGTWVWIPKP